MASSKEEATWPHVEALSTKSQRLAMLPGGTKPATHDLTATAISAARVAPIISHRREGGKRNLEDAHHRSPSEGDSFHRKTFRHSPEKFSPFSTYHHRVYLLQALSVHIAACHMVAGQAMIRLP